MKIDPYQNLNELCARDRRARQYFEQLPDYVQQQIRSRESNIHSFENLKDYAENSLRGDC